MVLLEIGRVQPTCIHCKTLWPFFIAAISHIQSPQPHFNRRFLAGTPRRVRLSMLFSGRAPRNPTTVTSSRAGVPAEADFQGSLLWYGLDRKSTRLNSSHLV